MLKRFLPWVPLFLVVLLLTTLLPSPASILCPLAAWASDRSEFGRDGRSGTDGRSGRDGRSGQSQTIFANGSPVQLDLSGQNGSGGDDGSNGENAYCERQRREVNYDLTAANGGRGGEGGAGGNGGNGGSLTVYYTTPADLKQIFVRSVGGDSGRGGRGGRGGYGCNCSRPRWEVKTCTGTPGSSDYRCETRRYSCRDGQDGSQGRDGGDGSPGQMGSLSLVKQQQALAEDTPTRTIALANLTAPPFTLSKNKWVTRTGANALLAPGSLLADSYREFVERLEGSFQGVWNEPEPIANFANQAATVTLREDRSVAIAFPEDLWVKSTVTQQGTLTRLIIANVIRKPDVTRLSVANFAQSGPNLQFSVVDLAGKSAILETQFQIKYRTSDRPEGGFTDYETRYEGMIPAQLVSRDYNRFILALGKLPIEAKYLTPGTRVEIELVAIRSLGERSAQQNISWQGQIRG